MKLIALPFGGIGNTAWFYGFLLIVVVLGVIAFFGRRRQRTARAKVAEQRAAAFGGAKVAHVPGRRARYSGCAATVLDARRDPRRRVARARPPAGGRRAGRGRPAGRAAARPAGLSAPAPRRAPAGLAVPRHDLGRDRPPPFAPARGRHRRAAGRRHPRCVRRRRLREPDRTAQRDRAHRAAAALRRRPRLRRDRDASSAARSWPPASASRPPSAPSGRASHDPPARVPAGVRRRRRGARRARRRALHAPEQPDRHSCSSSKAPRASSGSPSRASARTPSWPRSPPRWART